VGWFWFVGTLVPVIGLVQVGSQAMADRYTYVPLIGLFLLLVWGGAEWFGRLHLPRGAAAFGVAALVAPLMVLSWRQTAFWRDDLTLFGNAVAIDPDNALARNNLGYTLNKQWRFEEARLQFSEAVRIAPDYYDALNNLGLALNNLGRPQEAIPFLRRAILVNPRATQSYLTLGMVYVGLGDKNAALEVYRAFHAVDPAGASHFLLFVNSLPG
jgi:tetratricopeptide (TPR) repeat protein